MQDSNLLADLRSSFPVVKSLAHVSSSNDCRNMVASAIGLPLSLSVPRIALGEFCDLTEFTVSTRQQRATSLVATDILASASCIESYLVREVVGSQRPANL